MKKITAIAACLALPALAAYSLPAAAASTLNLTSTALTVTVTDNDLDDGITAGYSARNLQQGGASTAFSTSGYRVRDKEGFSVNTPAIVPMEAVASFNGVQGAIATDGRLGGFSVSVVAPDDILSRPTGEFLDVSFEAKQYFVLQPHTTLTFSGSYAFNPTWGTTGIPAEGGYLDLDVRMTLMLYATGQSVAYERFNFKMERDFTFQLTNDSDVVSEQYVMFSSWSDVSTRLVVPEVPEPATWGMMAAGLTLLALRARRNATA